MIDLDTAKTDPASVFPSPYDVLQADLSREEKIDILCRWAYDEREIAVAEEENMRATDNGHHLCLDEILRCLLQLGINDDQAMHPPTKQG